MSQLGRLVFRRSRTQVPKVRRVLSGSRGRSPGLTVQLDKGDGTKPQIDYQERADEDQGLPASQACGSAVVIGIAGSRSKPTGGFS